MKTQTAKNKKALIIVTSHAKLGNTGKATGYYLPEVTHPALALQEKGIAFDIASPKGGKAPLDESSRDLSDSVNRAFLENPFLADKLEHTLAPKDIDFSQYQAIIFAGGHGTMWDFPVNEELSAIAVKIYENGGVVAAICHGPAALTNIKLSNGKYLVDGKNLAAFSNAEEAAANLTEVMPFLLEDKLKELGAKHTFAPLWQEHVVVDGRLVTGQNPASGSGVGKAVANLLA